MDRQPTPKVIGAFVIGFAMVAGAYVLSNFGKPPASTPDSQPLVETQQASARMAIAVTDEDNNGIEDWRDEFITTDPIEIDQSAPYEPPDTLTGQTGVNFIQDIVRARSYGPGGSDEQVIESTISILEQQTSQEIYDTPDIILSGDNSDEGIRNYANALALAVLENNQTNLDNELLILQDVVNRQDKERIGELEDLAEIYRLTRDAVIAVPVPERFLKEHLDFINTLHAVHHDILGMTLTFDDPAYSLLRIKRYEDDIFGMIYALENIYKAFEPHASLFTVEDPAVFFTEFSPTNRIRI